MARASMYVTLVYSGHQSFARYYPFFSLGPVICYLELPLPLLKMRFYKSFSSFVLGLRDDPVTQDTNLVLPRIFFLAEKQALPCPTAKLAYVRLELLGGRPLEQHISALPHKGEREEESPEGLGPALVIADAQHYSCLAHLGYMSP